MCYKIVTSPVNVPFRQERCKIRGQCSISLLLRNQKHVGKARMSGQGSHSRAMWGNQPLPVERSKPLQKSAPLGQRRGGRGVEPVKSAGILYPPPSQLQGKGGQVGIAHFRGSEREKCTLGMIGPEPVTYSGAESARPAGPLSRGSG